MTMNPIDQDLANAYQRHGGRLKAWKHLGKKVAGGAADAVKKGGKAVASYFTDKLKAAKESTMVNTNSGVATHANSTSPMRTAVWTSTIKPGKPTMRYDGPTTSPKQSVSPKVKMIQSKIRTTTTTK